MVTEGKTSERRRGRPSNRRRVLDAATRVAVREGPGAVTIDAVVTEAGMSRGGVLYHFPSKDALLQALVDQDIDVVREMTGLASGEAATRPREQRVRAYYEACTAWPPERGHVALAVALANNPALLHTWAQVQRDLDGADTADAAHQDGEPTAAMVARLALDGLWFSDLVDRDRFTDEQRERVVSMILSKASGGLS
jgi:AcrR family transcriptional regulator